MADEEKIVKAKEQRGDALDQFFNDAEGERIEIMTTMPGFEAVADSLRLRPWLYRETVAGYSSVGIDLDALIDKALLAAWEKEDELQAPTNASLAERSVFAIRESGGEDGPITGSGTPSTFDTFTGEAPRKPNQIRGGGTISISFRARVANDAYYNYRMAVGDLSTKGRRQGASDEQDEEEESPRLPWELVIGGDTLHLTAEPRAGSRDIVDVTGVVDNPATLQEDDKIDLIHRALAEASAKKEMVLRQVPGTSRLLGTVEFEVAWSEFNREGYSLVAELDDRGSES